MTVRTSPAGGNSEGSGREVGLDEPDAVVAGEAIIPVPDEGSCMPSAKTTTFTESLEDHRASWSLTTAAEFEPTVRDRLVQPAVGAELPFDSVSLADLPISFEPSPADLEAAETGVTAAEFAVADYGTVVLTSGADGAEQISLFPEQHVAVVRASEIVPDMESAFGRLNDAFTAGTTSAVLATGPSATADMGALVYGAHGPRDVHVVVLTDR